MTQSSTDLSSLIEFIGSVYTFTEKSYPGYDALSDEQKMLFALRHSALHMMKSVGKIATEAEHGDHGGGVELEPLQVATAKMLVNTLVLAKVIGLSGEDLAALVPKVMVT